jgi:hypothetical protein
VGVDDQSWAFTRNAENLEIARGDEPGGVMLRIKNAGRTRAYRFSDKGALDRFQRDMESMLLGTGWSFVGFCPERRTGRERRGWPRLTERRRWWTDGVRRMTPAPSRSQSPSQ